MQQKMTGGADGTGIGGVHVGIPWYLGTLCGNSRTKVLEVQTRCLFLIKSSATEYRTYLISPRFNRCHHLFWHRTPVARELLEHELRMRSSAIQTRQQQS